MALVISCVCVCICVCVAAVLCGESTRKPPLTIENGLFVLRTSVAWRHARSTDSCPVYLVPSRRSNDAIYSQVRTDRSDFRWPSGKIKNIRVLLIFLCGRWNVIFSFTLFWISYRNKSLISLIMYILTDVASICRCRFGAIFSSLHQKRFRTNFLPFHILSGIH